MATLGENWRTLLAQGSVDLQHFIEAARKGRSASASGSQQRAWRIAQAIVADIAGMDSHAMNGAAFFCFMAAGNCAAAVHMLEKRTHDET